MKSIKRFVVFSLVCFIISTVFYWWYAHPINYINRIAALEIPFFGVSVVASEEKSTWQDFDCTYILRILAIVNT